MKNNIIHLTAIAFMLAGALVLFNSCGRAGNAQGNASSVKSGSSIEKSNNMDSLYTYSKALALLDKESYGGMYLDDNGNLNIWAKDVQKVKKVLGTYCKKGQVVVYREAKFSKAELERVYNKLSPNVSKLGITDTGIDEKNNCVTVGIYQLDKLNKQKKDSIKKTIHDFVKSDCINIVSDSTKCHPQ